jgi:hypothetical protein
VLTVHQNFEVDFVQGVHVVVLELLDERVDDSLVLDLIVLLVLVSTSINKLIIISESFSKKIIFDSFNLLTFDTI